MADRFGAGNHGGGALHAGDRRGHDAAGGASGDAAHRAAQGSGQRDKLDADARIDGYDPGAALGGLYRHLYALAGDFLDQSADCGSGAGAGGGAKTPWGQDGAAIEAAFPQLKDSILVVVDGQTPELAEDGAIRLSEALGKLGPKGPVISVRRPDGGPFFDRAGLLFADLPEVQQTPQRLIDAQPLLGGLAGDPSLHGIATTIDTVADGATRGTQDASRLADPLSKLSAAIDTKLSGKVQYFSWQRMFSGEKGSLAPPTRRMLIVMPRMDYGDLEPGAAAVDAIRAQAAALGLDAAHGMRVGITGEVPLADEEFASIREGMGMIGLGMVAAMLACLWLATRSAKT
ncbi:hypothetical protein E4T56_gene15172, partial [Termitomyces sp. T112]